MVVLGSSCTRMMRQYDSRFCCCPGGSCNVRALTSLATGCQGCWGLPWGARPGWLAGCLEEQLTRSGLGLGLQGLSS